MSETETTVKTLGENALVKRMAISEVAKQIDSIAQNAMTLFNNKDGGFEQELAVARAITDMRRLLTPEVMAPIMALMNTGLGFKTDKDPNRSKGTEPYGVEVVKDVFIEARIRGFRMTGNEVNIIAAQCYIAQNGYRRTVMEFPGLTDLVVQKAMPKTIDSKTAEVEWVASWNINGKPDKLEGKCPVKVDGYSSADQTHGKADRKILKTIHQKLTGQVTPDGEVEDIDRMKNVTPPSPQFTPMKPDPTDATLTQPLEVIPAEEKKAESQTVQERVAQSSSLKFRLYAQMEDRKVTDAQMLATLKRKGLVGATVSFTEVRSIPEELLKEIEGEWDVLVEQARIDAKAAAQTGELTLK